MCFKGAVTRMPFTTCDMHALRRSSTVRACSQVDSATCLALRALTDLSSQAAPDRQLAACLQADGPRW